MSRDRGFERFLIGGVFRMLDVVQRRAKAQRLHRSAYIGPRKWDAKLGGIRGMGM
jgi:hypothetical protein